MRSRLFITLAALFLCLAPVMAQAQPALGPSTPGVDIKAPPQAEFDIWWSSVDDEHEIHFQLKGGQGQAFAVFGSASDGEIGAPPSLVGIAPLDPLGNGQMLLTTRRWPGPDFDFTAVFKTSKRLIIVPGPFPYGDNLVCDSLDFDYTLGADWVMTAGQLITEQWADIGMHVTARNKTAGKPDKAILFDSDVPSLHDPDLVVGEGQLLIIAEDDVDVAPADGLVDVPNDSMFGGSLYFDFDMGYDLARVKVVDFDEPGSQLLFFRNGDVVTPDFVIDIPAAPNGKIQTLTFNQTNVTRLEIAMAGSGGIIGVCGVPCPRVINFDESPFGRPLGLEPGLVVKSQFFDSGLGVLISALNGYASGNKPGQNHPDKAVLFDSDFPSGKDWDLFAQVGNILIIGEDDFDFSPVDGLVDDPDDEAEGGMLIFDLGRDVMGFRATIVDVDETAGPAELRCYDEFDVMLGPPIPLVPGPDGNIQTITAEVDGMRCLVLETQGSASLSELRYCIRKEE
jgi:hypothetical protein